MITDKQIADAARFHYIGDDGPLKTVEFHFAEGAKWAVKQMQAENERLLKSMRQEYDLAHSQIAERQATINTMQIEAVRAIEKGIQHQQRIQAMEKENASLRAALESIAQTANRDNGSLSELIAEKAKTALEQ